MTAHSITRTHFAPSWSLRAVAGQAWFLVTAMLRARQTRRMLGDMDDRLLADIGIGRGDAAMEAARPMWDLAAKRR